MISFIIFLIARTARIACADRQTDIRDTTVILAAHTHQGLIIRALTIKLTRASTRTRARPTARVRLGLGLWLALGLGLGLGSVFTFKRPDRFCRRTKFTMIAHQGQNEDWTLRASLTHSISQLHKHLLLYFFFLNTILTKNANVKSYNSSVSDF